MAEAAGCAAFPPRYFFPSSFRVKVVRGAGRLPKNFKELPSFFREKPAAAAAVCRRPPSPRAGLSFWAAFPPPHLHARRVSAGVMRYLAERDGELLSQGESTAATWLRTDTLPSECNSPVASSPLSVAGRNKEGK